MPVSPRDFSDHADQVHSDYSSEIALRNVVSRKYYAAFLYVRENNPSGSGITFDGGSKDHRKAGALLDSQGEPGLKQDLHTLRKKRNKADYDINIDFKDSEAMHVLHLYSQFINNVRRIL